ncbi:hypothetical protein AGLY_016164 [Aphis glycines]|uniref:Uncharacterized protein n=1 Tax=Aphis glycines TaxID=307491 RepID=A0A6G0SZD2_APHGL|nr:hypothetical protein AGLY_016164 [Aphis glycines]
MILNRNRRYLIIDVKLLFVSGKYMVKITTGLDGHIAASHWLPRRWSSIDHSLILNNIIFSIIIIILSQNKLSVIIFLSFIPIPREIRLFHKTELIIFPYYYSLCTYHYPDSRCTLITECSYTCVRTVTDQRRLMTALPIQCTVLLMITTTLTIREDSDEVEEKFGYLRKYPKSPLIGQPFHRRSSNYSHTFVQPSNSTFFAYCDDCKLHSPQSDSRSSISIQPHVMWLVPERKMRVRVWPSCEVDCACLANR